MKHFRPYLAKTERVAQNLFMPTSKGREAIEPEDIIYLEAKVNYTIFHTTRKKIMTSFHLKFFDHALRDNPSFLRINRSYLVNINFLKSLDWANENKEAWLTDGTKLRISRRKAKELRELLMERLMLQL